MGSAKPKTHFLSTSPFFNPCVFCEKFNSYVSDLFTCKSSECCFVLAIWCPGSLSSFSFEVFSPRPRIRKQWFANSKKAREKKKAHQIPQYSSSKVHIVFKMQIVWSLSTSLTWQMYFGVPNWHRPWSYWSLPCVYMKVHTCSGWLLRTDPKTRWQALQDPVNLVCNPVTVDEASVSRTKAKKPGSSVVKTRTRFPTQELHLQSLPQLLKQNGLKYRRVVDCVHSKTFIPWKSISIC